MGQKKKRGEAKMKKTSLLVTGLVMLFSIIFPAVSNAESVTGSKILKLRVDFEKPVVKPNKEYPIYQELTMDGVMNGATVSCSSFGQPGEPDLPGMAFTMLIPADTKVSSIKGIEGPRKPVDFSGKIIPRQAAFRGIDKPEFTPPNPEIYGQDGIWTAQSYAYYGEQEKKGYVLINVGDFPVGYMPLSGGLFYYEYL